MPNIEGIEHGDLACAKIGIEFIEGDGSFAFGQILKSNTARAPRRISLIGWGDSLMELKDKLPLDNARVQRYYSYLKEYAND